MTTALRERNKVGSGFERNQNVAVDHIFLNGEGGFIAKLKSVAIVISQTQEGFKFYECLYNELEPISQLLDFLTYTFSILDVIKRFQSLIEKVKPYVEEILAVEIEERELNAAQKQLEKAENLGKNKDAGRQVPYRPQRTNWFSEKREAERAAKRSTKTPKKDQPKEKKQRKK